MKTNTKKLVISALFAALGLVATLFFAFPLPTGYANLGDCFAFAAGFCLGGVWGAAAAGIGIALADLLGGYGVYAIATFIIKAFIALCGAMAARLAREGRWRIVVIAAASLLGEAMMVLGYFFFESVFLGVGAAAIASVAGNLTQAAVGVVTSVLLAAVFAGNKRLKELMK
jgi:uncharacterized membrane protein